MDDLLKNITDVIVQPGETFRRLRESPMVVWGLMLIFVTQLISGLFSFDDAALYGIALFDTPVGNAVMSVIATVVATYVLHLIGKAMGGDGTYPSLISAMGFAQIPSIFYAPIALVATFLGSWFLGLGSLAVTVWVIVLGVISLKEVYRLTTGRAIGALILSGITVFFVIVILTVIALVLNLVDIGAF